MSFKDMGKQQTYLPPPLLLTSHGDQSGKQSFYNLLENRYHTMRIPVLRNKSVLCSAYGWLVLLDQTPGSDSEGECCIWNSTSLEIIQLPVVENPSHYNKCILSKPPTDPDCLILFNHWSTMEQIFCRIEDTAYFESILFDQTLYSLAAVVSFKGMIYGIVRFGILPKYEFVTIHIAGDKIEKKTLLIDGEHPLEVPQPIRSWIPLNRDYLIESPCGNELLLVTKMTFNQRSIVHFRIFRVDLGGMECEELYNLDGRTIFINSEGNGFCRFSESFFAAVKPNSIYYTHLNGSVMYVYDLDDRSTTTLLPYPDAGIDPFSACSYWVDLPDIPMKNNLYVHVS